MKIIYDNTKSFNELLENEVNRAKRYGEPNAQRIQDVLEAFNTLKLMMATNGKVSVTYSINNPYVNLGVVYVKGEKLDINDPELFYSAISKATNYEAFPKTDGTVCLNLTFHNVMKKWGGINNE